MGYFRVYYNPRADHLLTSWDIQVDTLGKISIQPMKLGRAPKRKVDNVVYEPPFFKYYC